MKIASLSAWIQAVVGNLRIDEWRRLEAESRAMERLGRKRPGATAHPPDLDHELNTLTDKQRQTLLLHYYADLSVESIAVQLHVSVGTVKSTLHRGRQALARLLQSADPPLVQTQEEMPMLREIPGWVMAGSHPRNYEHGLIDEKLEGKNVGYIRCIVEEPVGFGTVMQMIDAEEYRAQRIQLSCWARPSNVSRWAGMWLRVDESTGKQSAFDNMQQRPMKGTGRDTRRFSTLVPSLPPSPSASC